MSRRKRHVAGRQPAGTDEQRSAVGKVSVAGGLFPRHWILAAVAALWVVRPMFPSESAASLGDGLPAVMLWIVLAVLWLLGTIGQREFRVRFGWVDAAMAVLVGWHSIAAVWAASHLSARPAVNMLWEWVGLGVSLWLTRQVLVGRRETRAMAAVAVGLAVALAGYGLYQYLYELPDTRSKYHADPERYLADAGLGYAPGSPEQAMFEKRLASVEPLATFALTNSLAGVLAPWIVVLVGIAAVGLPRRRTPVVLLGIAGCALAMAACLLLTKSRSGYLATLFGLVLVAAVWRRKTARLPWKPIVAAALVLGVLVAGVVAVGGLDLEVFSEASKSLGYRGQYWQATLAMIADHPLLGCGPGNFQQSYTAYKLPEASEEIADPHNFLLEIWATAGTPAMLALAALVVALLAGRGADRSRPDTSAKRPNTSPKRKQASGDELSSLARRANVAHSAPDGPKPLPSGHADDHPWFVYGGAAVGFLLAIPVGFLSEAPPGLLLVGLTLPLAAGTAVVLSGWVRDGQLPPSLPTIGAIVLLTNLSAAGGIGFPGVSGGLWLLVALVLNGLEGDGGRPFPRAAGVALLAAFGALACACYATAYGPVLKCQRGIWLAQRHLAERHPLQAEKCLLEAAEADWLAADPWNRLASLALARWNIHPSEETLREIEHYSEKTLAKAPNSASLWQAAGERYDQAFAKTRDPRLAAAAVDAYRRAVQLYPNSAVLRAKLAIALRAVGDKAGYQEQRDQALRLDRVTPHLDKKLPPELRNSL